jgi:hypothetical protein
MSKYIAAVIVVAIAYAAGRYTAPEKIKTEIKTVEVEKVVTKVQHKKVVIRENKDGSKETVIITDTKSDEKGKSNTDIKNKEVTNKGSFNISVLAGSSVPINGVLGVSATKNVLGPITVGAWGLTNGTAGLSVGLNF